MFDLQGKVALVTGGSRGIGRAIAIRLAENGVQVVVNYVRHKRDAEETASVIEKQGGRCLLVKANVAEEADVEAMFEIITKEFGVLDILVSNAASGVLKPVMELTQRHWDWAMDINARALLTLVQRGFPLMSRGSRVLAVSSLGATRAIENYTTVGASKAALESLVRHLAVEFGPEGINVNTLSAGAVDTDALKKSANVFHSPPWPKPPGPSSTAVCAASARCQATKATAAATPFRFMTMAAGGSAIRPARPMPMVGM